MRTKITITGILMFLCLISFSQKSKNYQKLVLDEYYSHLKKKDATDKATHNYQVKKADGIILDCSKFDFSAIKELNGGKMPESIFIVADGGNYSIPLNATGETIIDKTTMTNLGGDKKFPGFKKGDTPILGIGYIQMEGQTAALKTLWVTMLDIK